MSPVASRWEVPRKSVGLGVGEGDVPAGVRVVLPVFVGLGVVGGDRVGDQPVDDDRAAGAAVGEVFVDPDRGGLGEAVGLAGDPRACQAGTSKPGQPFPEDGEAVAQVEGVGDQLCPGRRGHAQRQRERFGGERRHRRVCRPRPSDSSARSAAPPNVSTPGVRQWQGAGRPSAQRAGACGTRVRGCSRSSARGRARARRRRRGRRPRTRSRTVVLMGLSQASTTDTRGRESPVSTGDSRIVTSL